MPQPCFPHCHQSCSDVAVHLKEVAVHLKEVAASNLDFMLFMSGKK